MGWLTTKAATKTFVALVTMALILAGVGPFPLPKAAAAELIERSIRMSDAIAAQNNVTYRTAFTTQAATMMGSIVIQFCSNGSLLDEPCTGPVGFDASGAVLASQFGATGFSISPASTANEIILTRPSALEGAGSMSYNFTTITNPFSGGSSFARIYTYPTSDASGPYTDAGGFALYYRPSFGVITEVPPHLKFCLGESINGLDCTTATEPFSNIGNLGPLVTGVAQTQMLAATNAGGGYTMWVLGGTMTSGNNTIPAMAGAPSTKGTSQFGLNLRANTNPVIGNDLAGPGLAGVAAPYYQQNQFRFQSGDVVATVATPDDFRKYTVSYVVNVDSDQSGGVYATTLTYLVLANF